jgi:hypothetical protein
MALSKNSVGWAPPTIEGVVAPRSTSAITAKQELGKTKGVPKQEPGNERKNLVYPVSAFNPPPPSIRLLKTAFLCHPERSEGSITY